MNKRYITLGNGKSYGLDAYVAGIKLAIANPTTEFKAGLTGWWPVTGAEVARQFLAGVHDRINAGVAYTERGK